MCQHVPQTLAMGVSLSLSLWGFVMPGGVTVDECRAARGLVIVIFRVGRRYNKFLLCTCT